MTTPGDTGAESVHETLLQLRIPVDLSLSPDGERVAYALASASGNGTHVWIVDVDGGIPRMLPAPGATTTRCPRWSATGDVIVAAFSDTATSLSSLVVLDPQTGAHLLRQSIPGFIEDIVVAGSHVVVRFADPGSEQDGMHWGCRLADENDPWVNWPGRRWRRLAVTDLALSQFRVLDLVGWTVWDVDVNREGTILAVASRDPLPSGYYQPTLIKTSVSGEEPRQLWDGAQRQLSRPRLASDGGDYAYVLRGISIVSGTVHRVDVHCGETTELAGLDDVTDMGSLPDGRFWFSGWTDAGVQLGLFKAGGEVEIRLATDGLVTGRDGQPSLVVDGRRSRAFGVWENGNHPPEISAIDLDDPTWHQLTGINDSASRVVPLIERRWVRWESTEGVEVRGLLILPKYHDGPMPLVTIIHGGPTWLVPDAFSPSEACGLALPLALAGTAVLMPNPRGSSGRGQAYAGAVIGRLGDVDLHDVLSGVDQMVDRGVADPQRMAVMGLSYGGFLSAWALTQTNRFRAGVVMSGVADWLSFSQTSNIGRGFTALYHGCSYETSSEGRQRLLEHSPAHQAAHAMAPLLIIHGEQDRVTPVGQAEQLFGAWTREGAEGEIIVYPREGHELAEPEHLRDVRRRVFTWLEKHEVMTRSEIE